GGCHDRKPSDRESEERQSERYPGASHDREHSQPQPQEHRAAIAHEYLRWIPRKRQEAKDGPGKDGGQDSDALLTENEADDGDEKRSDTHHSCCQSVESIDQVDG